MFSTCQLESRSGQPLSRTCALRGWRPSSGEVLRAVANEGPGWTRRMPRIELMLRSPWTPSAGRS